MASRALARDKPKAVRAPVLATTRAAREAAADPEAGVAVVAAREPLPDRAVETARLRHALRTAMMTSEVGRPGLGDVDDRRLAASIATVISACDLPRRPVPTAVFDRRFLPTEIDRMPDTDASR